MRRRERLSLSPQPFNPPSTPERSSSRSSLRARVQWARAGGDTPALRELRFTARWAIGREALDAAVLQYDFQGRFVQLIDAHRSPLEWRDTADAGEWRLTATHSGELLDSSRGEARHYVSVHLDEVCPNVQSLFFAVCARDSTVGRAISRQQVELRALEHAGRSIDLPVLLPLGGAAAAAGSAVVCRVWRRSVADGWRADRVGLPAPAIRGDEYDGLINAVASWLSVQMSASDTPDDAVPRPMSPLRTIAAAEPHAAGCSNRTAGGAIADIAGPHAAAASRLASRDRQAGRQRDTEREAREQLEEDVARLREQLARSKEGQHAASQHVARLKAANHKLQALVRTQRSEFEKAQKTAADSHAAELVLLNQRRRSVAATRKQTVATGLPQRPAVGADLDGHEAVDDRSQPVLLAELQALQTEHDAKCEELACCQSRLKSSNSRVELVEQELQELRERSDSEAVDAVMAVCTEERVASLETFLEEEKASKREIEAERDTLRDEKKSWARERRRMVALETKLREQIRELKGKVAQVRNCHHLTQQLHVRGPIPRIHPGMKTSPDLISTRCTNLCSLLSFPHRRRSRWSLYAPEKLSGAISARGLNAIALSSRRSRQA